MQFAEALEVIENSGIAMVMEPNNGIHGVAIGQKDGGPLDGSNEYCLTAFVSRKFTPEELQAENIVAFNQAAIATLQEADDLEVEIAPAVDTDVVEIGDAFELMVQQRGKYGGNPPALNAQKPFQTLRCGIGITNPIVDSYPSGLSVGTAGFYMRDDNDEPNHYVVSNNHVIGGSNAATIGDIVVQPGTIDLTGLELRLMPNIVSLGAQAKIGELSGFVLLQFPTPVNVPLNRVDAAIARLDPDLNNMDDIDRLTYGGCVLGVAEPYVGDQNGNLVGSPRVYKVGRTTGYTEGVVTNVAARVSIPYSGGNAMFVNQIVVEATADNVGPFSDRGDSGSGVLNDRHELVGLLFAGSPERTLVNPIADVINELCTATGLNLDVVTG